MAIAATPTVAEKVIADAEEEELPKAVVKRLVKHKLSQLSQDGGDMLVPKDSLMAFAESSRIFIHYLSATVVFSTSALGVGINHGQIANNLPQPSQVSVLLKTLNISRVKLYDAEPKVLSSFANSNIEFIIGLGNEYLLRMQDPQEAQIWIQQKGLSIFNLVVLLIGFFILA